MSPADERTLLSGMDMCEDVYQVGGGGLREARWWVGMALLGERRWEGSRTTGSREADS